VLPVVDPLRGGGIEERGGAAAEQPARLGDEHPGAGSGQRRGGCQPRHPGADHDGVGGGAHQAVPATTRI
jgi:hypothetical protein